MTIETHLAVVSKIYPEIAATFEGTEQAVFDWLSSRAYPLDDYQVYDVNGKSYQDALEFLSSYKDLMFVPKFYRMNPKTEDLLPNGAYLTNGMKVLIADSKQRIDISRELRDWEEDRALENNRWCTVGGLEVGEPIVRFIAVYEDGSKRMRSIESGTPWLVEIDSVRDSANLHTDRYQAVFDAVKVSLAKHEELVSRHDYPADAIYNHIEETTKALLGLL